MGKIFLKNVMHTKILSYIHAITPHSFLWIYVGVWAVLLLVGYFLSDTFYVFMSTIMAIMGAVAIYQYQNPPIKKNHTIFLYPLFGLVYGALISSGLLFQPELIADKAQARQTAGIIPETHEYIRGSGKGAKSHYYLTVNGQRFHCDDDNYDDCELIYAYKGQSATIYHHEGLAYEIEVGGQKVYEFSAQAQKFKATQDKRLWQLIWAVILFGLPSVVFYFVNKIVIRDLAVIQEDAPPVKQDNLTIKSHTGELLVGERKPPTKRALIRTRMMAGGHAWRILFGVFGTLSLTLFLLVLTMGSYLKISLFLVLSVLLYYVASLPRQNAKKEVTFYLEMLEIGEDMGELSDYESSGFYNHMGVIAWVMLAVCVALAFLFGSMFIWGIDGDSLGFVIFLAMCALLFVALAGFVVKKAMHRRDLATE